MEPSHVPRHSKADIEVAASSLLQTSFPRGIDPPVDIDLVAEKQPLIDDLGFLSELSSRFSTDAVLLSKHGGRFDIIVDSDSIRVRANFSVAHELGHVVLHPELYSGCVTIEDSIALSKRIKQSYRGIEGEANQFAGAILVPRKSIFSDVEKVYEGILRGYAGNIGWEQAISMLNAALANRYRVSTQTMEIRLGQLHITRRLLDAVNNKYDFISWD